MQNFQSPLGCCCCSVAKSCLVPLSSTISRSLLKFVSFESVMLFNHRILRHSLLLLPSIFPSIRWEFIIQFIIQWIGSLHQVAKILELQQESFQWMLRVDFPSGDGVYVPRPWIWADLRLLQPRKLHWFLRLDYKKDVSSIRLPWWLSG